MYAALEGTTYHLSIPDGSTLCLTVNNIHGENKIHEILIFSTVMDNFQWVVGLMKVLNLAFQADGEHEFLIAELKQVIDPKQGYFVKGLGYMPSVVAHIGHTLDHHLNRLKEA